MENLPNFPTQTPQSPSSKQWWHRPLSSPHCKVLRCAATCNFLAGEAPFDFKLVSVSVCFCISKSAAEAECPPCRQTSRTAAIAQTSSDAMDVMPARFTLLSTTYLMRVYQCAFPIIPRSAAQDEQAPKPEEPPLVSYADGERGGDGERV
ncbi:hypothetical protein B0H12DRAFT_554283 [Mycena haematopus]|nr:hypothetical protein B0H12DRAFT_554283 [Mycena haematopus]